MLMRTKLIAGNWKMNGTQAQVQAWARAAAELSGQDGGVEVAIFPSHVHLSLCRQAATGSPLIVGAQDLSLHRSGAYTGEVGGEMLVDLQLSHVLVGHSERRSYHHETDAVVAAKTARALECGLTPVVCVGETLAERDADATEAVLSRQLEAVLDQVGSEGIARCVLAYEPVWAIGTGRTATPEQAQAAHRHLRDIVTRRSAIVASLLRILYGGSVKGSNAQSLFAQADVDGGLVGGASLDPVEFATIVGAARG